MDSCVVPSRELSGVIGMRTAAIVACLTAPADRVDAGVGGPHAHAGAVAGRLAAVRLGCPGDWQPECPPTRLAPVAGSPACSGRRSVPAGNYEYKVALNNTWDENYGAGGAPGGANIPITAPGGTVTFTYDHQTHVISDSAPRPLQAPCAARTGCARA